MEPRQVPDDTEKTPQLEVQLTPPAPSVPFYPPDSLTVGVESSSQEHPVLSDNVEPWPPQPPDVDLSDAITDTEQKPFATGSFSQIHVYKGNRALKHGANPRELVLMRQAGECSVQAFGRVMMKDKKTGVAWMTGMMMSLERPLVVTKVEPNLRKHLMYQMIDLVHCLHHRYGIVHGDLKPDNMLLCSDGRLRFCDFAEARPMNEDPELWEGQTTANYLAPD